MSFVELFSLSLVIPFLALVNNTQLIMNNKYLYAIYRFFSFTSPLRFLFVFGILLIVIMLFRGVVNLCYFYLLTKFSKTRYRTLSYRLFERYLSISYIDYSRESSSTLIHNVLNESLYYTNFLFSILLIVSECIIIALIYLALMIINWEITVTLSFAIALVSFIILRFAKPIISNAGVRRSVCQKELIRTLNETFGNFKFIKLLNNKKHFEERFFSSSSGFVRAEAIQFMFGIIPKIIMETAGICILLVVLLYALIIYKEPSMVVSLLAMYAIAFFRLLPSANRIMLNVATLVYFKDTISILSLELGREVESKGAEKINFTKEINLRSVSFSYDSQNEILSDINLIIPKGSKVAIVGPSGCGKSTFIDVLSGLLIPTKGEVSIDNVLLQTTNKHSWREKIGYIPQNIYLFNGTVKENVVCGRVVDELKVIKALKKAKIYDFLLSQEGLNTNVGENGVMLSGGQKQRIAIARALYSEPSIFVLDEATSALDKDIESEIMNEIFELGEDITIIMVSHREYFLKNCDIVYRMKLNNNKDLHSEHVVKQNR